VRRVERDELASAITDVQKWHVQAGELHFLSLHMPLSRPVAVPDADSVLRWAHPRVLAICAEVTRRLPLSEAAKPSVRRARKDLVRDVLFGHGNFATGVGPARLAELLSTSRAQYESEKARLQEMAHLAAEAGKAARSVLHAVEHMPLSRQKVVTVREQELLGARVTTARHYADGAAQLASGALCRSGRCAEAHGAARALADVHEQVTKAGGYAETKAITARVAEQFQSESKESRKRIKEMRGWPVLAESIRSTRAKAPERIASHLKSAAGTAHALVLNERRTWLLPLAEADLVLDENLRLLRDCSLSKADEKVLAGAEARAVELEGLAGSALQPSGECHRDQRCSGVHDALAAVLAKPGATTSELRRLAAPPEAGLPAVTRLEGLLDPTLRLRDYFAESWRPDEVLGADLVERCSTVLQTVLSADRARKKARQEARKAADAVRARDVQGALREMDVETLRKASQESIRVAPLHAGGLHNVWDVLEYCDQYYLDGLDGIGPSSAFAIEQAARRLHEGVRDEMPVRIDVKGRHADIEALLNALRRWDAARRFDPTPDEVAVADGFAALFKKATRPSCVLVLTAPGNDEAVSLAPLVEGMVARCRPPDTRDVWSEFLARPADYFGLLTELGFLTEDAAKMHGDLPEEIVTAVRGLELRKDHLKASLRMYQAFAAKFSIVQEKVVIGDEMGLGKTVEALAVLTHLRSTGRRHFLVVCPAAVVSNWIRETGKHTDLKAFRLHGNQYDRRYAATSWVRQGGIAVTTYDLLGWARDYLSQAEVDSAIFDEAHYVKNPNAKRSINTQAVIDTCRYAVLMTGTPLENNVQEFRNIVGYLRPDLADTAPEYLPSAFRKHVAPAYLRRNQEDVLSELPDLVEVEEWLPMSASDAALYRDAVAEGNFMLMRRAAMLDRQSEKLQRLSEIVTEAEANQRRVIVFSYFREVLDLLVQELPGSVFGPITGSVPAAQRQVLVDRFSAAAHGAVLVSQIAAGGVGLNIQSASVVVICEPQLKPTSEAQAIARAHRMGQTNTVQVHRLLSEGAVDERIRVLLAEKLALFNEFARSSVIKDQAPDAVDITDAELARQVVAAERERLLGAAAGAGAAERQ
jgi:superfamily II DNA or RNA helicase